MIGVSRGPIQSIERGHIKGVPFKKVTGTMRSYARILGWTDGSVDTVLAGGEPTHIPGLNEGLEGIPLRIREEVRGGRVLDSGTYDLSPDDTDLQLLVMVTVPASATAEQLRRYMQVWKRTERELKRISKTTESEPESNTP